MSGGLTSNMNELDLEMKWDNGVDDKQMLVRVLLYIFVLYHKENKTVEVFKESYTFLLINRNTEWSCWLCEGTNK